MNDAIQCNLILKSVSTFFNSTAYIYITMVMRKYYSESQVSEHSERSLEHLFPCKRVPVGGFAYSREARTRWGLVVEVVRRYKTLTSSRSLSATAIFRGTNTVMTLLSHKSAYNFNLRTNATIWNIRNDLFFSQGLNQDFWTCKHTG